MLFDSVKRNAFAISTSCLCLLVLLWGSSLLGQSKPIHLPRQVMPLQQLIAHWFYGSYVIAVLMGAVAVLATGMLLYRLNEKHLFVGNREQLLAIVFVLLASAFSSAHYLLGIHIALIFIILMLNSVFKTYRRDDAFGDTFWAGIYLSIATLFYAPAIYLVIVFIGGLSLMKSLQWRDCTVALAGLFVPYMFALFYYFFTLAEWYQPFYLLVVNLQIVFPITMPVYSVTEWVYLGYLVIMILFSGLQGLFARSTGVKIKTIRINLMFAWMFIIALFCYLVYPAQQPDLHLLLISLPATVLIANFFGAIKKNKWANFLFVALFLSVAAIQIPAQWYATVGNIAKSIWNFIEGIF